VREHGSERPARAVAERDQRRAVDPGLGPGAYRIDAVKALLSMAIRAAKKQGKYVGICGQGPSDHEDFAAWLMEEDSQRIQEADHVAVDATAQQQQ
ncbi:hypothetical protein FK521_28265, partial [Klebsiella pneumoniae]|nr:hypothetical protein [Klebsiella pneumoniae]